MLPPIARRFVAGESVPEALDHVRACNEDGIAVVVNLLGEHHDDPAAARADVDAYLALLDDVADSGLDARISVKPSQIGLDVSAELFEEHYRETVAHADGLDAFVWCDMEDADTTDDTLDPSSRSRPSIRGASGSASSRTSGALATTSTASSTSPGRSGS
jgi:proline dehydrogenase